MKKFFSLAAAALCALSAIAADDCTVAFTVNPPMHCNNCENKIKSNLRFEKGIKKIDTDLKGQLVTVTFDPSKTDEGRIAEGFKKIGYEASVLAKPKPESEVTDSLPTQR